MAEYGIVMQIQSIKGNIALSGYADAIGVHTLSFTASATRHGTAVKAADSTSVNVNDVNVLIHAGKWTAELLAALYNVTDLGDVTISQLAQSVDGQATAAPTLIQKIVLSHCHITAVAQAMEGGGTDRDAALTLEFSHIVHSFDAKTADFITKNWVEKAV
jgi:type VI protein secretion system component Hcp